MQQLPKKKYDTQNSKKKKITIKQRNQNKKSRNGM